MIRDKVKLNDAHTHSLALFIYEKGASAFNTGRKELNFIVDT